MRGSCVKVDAAAGGLVIVDTFIQGLLDFDQAVLESNINRVEICGEAGADVPVLPFAFYIVQSLSKLMGDEKPYKPNTCPQKHHHNDLDLTHTLSIFDIST